MLQDETASAKASKPAYNFPNDEEEQERYDIMHAVFLTAMDDHLFLAPLNQDLGRILDIGTGTGIWAIQIGRRPCSFI